MVRTLREGKGKNSKNEVVKKDLSSHEDSHSEIPVRETSELKVGDIIFDPALGARRITQKDIDKRKRLTRQAEEQRRRREQEVEEHRKILQEINRKKFQPESPSCFKPSRMIDIDSDVAIMNIETMVTSIKESVEFLENKLWEIEDYLYRHDKKKRESLKLKKLKRKAKKR
jgi:hypothetical protein